MGSIAGAGAVAVVVAVAVVLAVTVGPCSNDDEPPDATPRSTTTTLSPEQEVEAAYLAFAEMGARLLQEPNPNDPEIAQRATGQAREDLVNGLASLQESNQRYELGPQYGQQVLSMSVGRDQADAEVCVVEDSRRLDATTGEVLAQGVTTAKWAVRLLHTGQQWFVDEITELENWDGEVECT